MNSRLCTAPANTQLQMKYCHALHEPQGVVRLHSCSLPLRCLSSGSQLLRITSIADFTSFCQSNQSLVINDKKKQFFADFTNGGAAHRGCAVESSAFSALSTADSTGPKLLLLGQKSQKSSRVIYNVVGMPRVAHFHPKMVKKRTVLRILAPCCALVLLYLSSCLSYSYDTFAQPHEGLSDVSRAL